MHNKTFQIILFVYLLLSLGIPSSLGVFGMNEVTSGIAGIAGWSVSITPDNNNSMQLIPNGVAGSYTLVVESSSEVDTAYSIVVSNIPSGVEVKIDTENNYRTPTNNKVTFSNVGTILYNAQQRSVTHTLSFRAVNGATLVNNQSVHVDVIFQQVV